jgi:ActR/RegA family two-component response regulator
MPSPEQVRALPPNPLPTKAQLAIGASQQASADVRLKILLVDDDDNEVFLTRRSLEAQNCEVVSATCVVEALKEIAAQRFDVLITDLHMPDAGDGFAVVTAMRHTQPEVLTLVTSDYPDVQRAMAAILLQVDEVLIKPFDATQLAGLLDKRKLNVKPPRKPAKESVASILDREADLLMQRWLARVEKVAELAAIPVAARERTAYLPEMIRSLTARLRAFRAIEATDSPSPAAVAHGRWRYTQGYAAPLIVQESRLLQISIFETIERNLSTVDFTAVLPDLMIVADEVDSQLKQTIDSFLTMEREEADREPEALASKFFCRPKDQGQGSTGVEVGNRRCC